MINKNANEKLWSKFFTSIGVEYYYKEITLETPKGVFTPSFFLPDVNIRKGEQGIFFHVGNAKEDKRIHLTKDEYFIEQAMKTHGIEKMIVTVETPTECMKLGGDTIEKMYDSTAESSYKFSMDSPMIVCKCHECGHVKFEFPEGSYMNCPKCKAKCDDEHEDILNALDVVVHKKPLNLLSDRQYKRVLKLPTYEMAQVYLELIKGQQDHRNVSKTNGDVILDIEEIEKATGLEYYVIEDCYKELQTMFLVNRESEIDGYFNYRCYFMADKEDSTNHSADIVIKELPYLYV